MEISFMCKYCLESTVRDVDSVDLEYPKVCPSCKTTSCSECRGILKFSATLCTHCGELAPDYRSNFVRTNSASAAYAEENWFKRVKRWRDDFGELEDENRSYEVWIDKHGNKTLKEETVEDGERKILEEEKLDEEEKELLQERKEEIEQEFSEISNNLTKENEDANN